MSRFLQRNREMLAAIDAKAGEIEWLLDGYLQQTLDGFAASPALVPAS